MPKEETIVTTITVSRKLHKAVKIQSVKEGRSASSIYEEGAEALLKKKTDE